MAFLVYYKNGHASPFAAKSIPIFLSKHKNTLIFLVIFQNEHLDRSNFLFDYPYFFIYIMLKQAFEFICSSLNHWIE